MTVSERLRSCRSSSRLAHHGDLRSSQQSKPQKSSRPPFEWTTGRSLLWYPLRIVLMEGHISHSSRVLRRCHLEKSSCFLKFGCRSFTKHAPWSVCFLIAMWKKLACFYELQIGRISMNISLPDSVLETNKTSGKSLKFDLPNYFSLWTIADCELWWFDISDSFGLVQPMRSLEPF